MKITYSNIRLHKRQSDHLALVHPDVTLDIPVGRGTVQWLYEHLNALGFVFAVAYYSHTSPTGKVVHAHQRRA